MRINHSIKNTGEGPPAVGGISPFSLFICSPCYSGDFNHNFVSSLLQTCKLLDQQNIRYTVYFEVFNSLVAASRNALVDVFLKSNCTHILMIDSDQGWNYKVVPEMLKLNKQVLTGAVPARKTEETYAIKILTNMDMTPVVNNEGLIACDSNGVAFGMIRRDVFDKVKADYKQDIHPYFQHRYYENGDHYGEDTYFIKTCRDAMIDVWIYPNITFTHGPITANYHNFLCRQPGGSEDENGIPEADISQ